MKAGLARAKAQAKKLGRPKVNGKIEKAVLAARAKDTGKCKISKQLGIGVSSVNRILSEAASRRDGLSRAQQYEAIHFGVHSTARFCASAICAWLIILSC